MEHHPIRPGYGSKTATFGYGFMAVTAIAVALWSLRYFGVAFDVWIAIDKGIRGVITHIPLRSVTHMLIAPIALLLGPLQFLPGFRARYPKVHRYAGRTYVAACVIAGLTALAMTPYASGGPVAGLGFGILAVSWIATTLGGWWAAVRRHLDLHRLCMRLSYAMTFGAVMLRLQIPFGLMLGYTSYSAMSVWLAYTSWIPNVLVVLAYTALERARARTVGFGDAAARSISHTGRQTLRFTP
jgi:hypothetical protein